MIIALFFHFMGLKNAAAEIRPSSQSCDYYLALESKLHCGPDAYLQQVAYPLCRRYLDQAEWTSEEIQNWFPKVRLCLQQELDRQDRDLNCNNLNEIASQSHRDCYVRTGYCHLSWKSNAQLAMLTLSKLRGSWWTETAQMIFDACKKP
jgi:hypothetical protein